MLLKVKNIIRVDSRFEATKRRILKNDTEDFDFAGRRSARTVLRCEQVHVQCDLRDAGKNSALKFILIEGSYLAWVFFCKFKARCTKN